MHGAVHYKLGRLVWLKFFFEDTQIAHCRQYGLVGYVIIGHERSTLKLNKDYADTRRSAA